MRDQIPDYQAVFSTHDAPDAMAAFAAELWHERIADLRDRGLLTSGRIRTVDRYVRAVTEYQFLYPAAMSEGPALISDNGAQYANQRWHAIGRLNDQIMKFEAALCIPPKPNEGEPVKDASPRCAADEYLD